jgi:SET domain-containing protein
MNTKKPLPKTYFKVKRGINGFGLFAAQDIPRNTYLMDYAGKLLTTAQADEKGGQYLFEINSHWTIDGTNRKNLARYINHSCRPNCETDTRDREKRVVIYTIRNVKAGDELSYDYGKSFWNEYIKPKGCRCPKCAAKATA